MACVLPISLTGDTLGQRRRHLNTLVNETFKQNVPFSSIQLLTEYSPIDRLFKINLASKTRNIDYIISNLKDEDMLYVSTALKSHWLLEEQYENILNPIYLERNIYPEMTTTAVNKVKHWIHLNLRDASRCAQFYEYYSTNEDLDLAIKFLSHCSKEFVLSKVSDVFEKLTPKYLKVLSERYPEVAKLYFDNLPNNDIILSKYLENENKYYNNLRCILKTNANIFLDITEKYFNKHKFRTFSSEATKYIMNNHKNRYNEKPELYASWLLDIDTLAGCLGEEEIKDLVTKLARAQYLSSWFDYKAVEPLLKSLNVKERTVFKKQIFVDKSFGEATQKWPYDPPSAPQIKMKEADIFDHETNDKMPNDMLVYLDDESNYMLAECSMEFRSRRCNKKCIMARSCFVPQKTYLDKLFDQYRVSSFEKTLAELARKMTAENMKNRQDMMLVLISKSGGHSESVETLLKLFMERHENEPANLRATIVRSFVKRCSAWRLPQHVWELLLMFGRDLGLNGAQPTAPCIEGLHAVVLRNILCEQECEAALKKEFLKEFSTLGEYTLNSKERKMVSMKLPEMLLIDASENPSQACTRLQQLLDTLEVYKVRADRYPGVIPAIASTVNSDPRAKMLLFKLYNARVARRELFEQNFSIIQNGASYFNALKHDIHILNPEKLFQALIEQDTLKHDRFLKSLTLFFGEKNGLAEKYLSILERNAEQSPKNIIARSLAFVAGDKMIQVLQRIDARSQHKASKRLSAALRANIHLTRPHIDLNFMGWSSVGAKAVATKVVTCSATNVSNSIEKLLSWDRTTRIAFVLSLRVHKEASTLAIVAQRRPKLALKTVLWHNKRRSMDPKIWDVVIPLITRVDISRNLYRRFHKLLLTNIAKVPKDIKADYSTAAFKVLQKISEETKVSVLMVLETIVPELDDEFIDNIIGEFLVTQFTEENLTKKDHRLGYIFIQSTNYYMRIIAKYLLLCRTESIQSKKIEYIARPLCDCVENYWKIFDKDNRRPLMDYIRQFTSALKFNTVFLDSKYITCIPVFEYIIKRLQSIMPIESNFSVYVHLHLSMLYFKSVRNCIKYNSNIFTDSSNRRQAVEVVGNTFGSYIASEANELQGKYFESIIDLYKIELVSYMRDYFIDGKARNLFLVAVIKGILNSEHIKSHLLAEYLYNKERYDIPDNANEEIKELFKEASQQVQFLYYARSFG